MKRILSAFLSVIMVLYLFPALNSVAVTYTYDPDAAVAYAKAHYNDGKGKCAEFVSDCLVAGGFTAVYNVNARALGRQLQGYGTVITCSGWSSSTCLTASMFNGTLSKGDIIIWENVSGSSSSGHAMLYSGKTDSKGRILVYAHNVAKNEEVIMPSSDAATVYAISLPQQSGESYNFTTIPYGTYYLKNKATGTYLTVKNMTDANGQNVHVYELLENEAQRACQQMTITSEANGQKLRPELCADRVINAYADNVTSGVNVTIYDNTYHASQRWAFEPVDGGYVIHNSQNPSCVLDTNGDNVLVVTKHGGDSQIWILEEVGHEHSFDEFIYYEDTHPHMFVYKCSCGEYYIDPESSYTAASCIECNTPEMPGFIGLRTQYGSAEPITFEWTETENTTHNNWLLYREGTNGWEQIERVDYAECGLTRTLAAGKYKTAVQAYNSNVWNEAGTDWLYTQSDDYTFTVVESHTHSYGEWVETVTATCISGGIEQRECECGDIESRSTESLGHDWDEEYTIDIQPTETEAGLKSRHCSRCEAVTDEIVMPKVEHEHIYGEWQTVVEPTCVENGQKKKLCECGASKQVIIESLGHDYADEWTVVTPPTETSKGYEARKCSRCTFLTDVKTIPALGTGLPFVDIEEGKWYYPSVEYAVDNGLFNGVDSTHFAPDRAMSRAMLVSVLYRMEGSPAVSGNMPFGDVAGERYYYSAVLWASQNGIVNGVSADSFAPDDVITREQMAAILYRYASYKGYDTSAVANLITYPDAMEISSYAVTALSWANAEGLITGTTSGEQVLLNPKGEATRAQVATILMRFTESAA